MVCGYLRFKYLISFYSFLMYSKKTTFLYQIQIYFTNINLIFNKLKKGYMNKTFMPSQINHKSKVKKPLHLIKSTFSNLK